ncbi:MAG: hypothetical protein H6661_00350 [Ardenticatenaceae bacterium]|nr:hypothetical protein [Ardenticatenaceae bacterium]
MDYGQVISDAWRITWNNKYLWVLGFLAALTSVGSNGNSFNYSFNEGDFANPAQAARIGGLVLGLVCLFMIIGLVLLLVSVAARGGLIEAVNRLDDGEKLTLGEAFSAGTKSMWRLIGVYLVTFLPLIIIGIVVAIIAVAAFGGTVAMSSLENPNSLLAGGLGIFGLCMCLLACALIPISIVLTFVAELGARATVINRMRITESISRGWQIFRANMGPVIILAILLFVIGIIVSVVMAMILLPLSLIVFGPALVSIIANEGTLGSVGPLNMAWMIGGGLCLGVIGAALMSVYQTWMSAVWTLAYKALTGKGPEVVPAAKVA